MNFFPKCSILMKKLTAKRSIRMSKGNKKIQVEVKETPNNREGFVELELYVNDEKIGQLQQEEGQTVTVKTNSGTESKVRTVDEGINKLIMDYNKIDNIEIDGIDTADYPDFADAYILSADYNGVEMSTGQLDKLNEDSCFVHECIINQI